MALSTTTITITTTTITIISNDMALNNMGFKTIQMVR